MSHRKIVKRTGRRTVRVRVKQPKAYGKRGRSSKGWLGWIFGTRRIHKHTGKPGWWLN